MSSSQESAIGVGSNDTGIEDRVSGEELSKFQNFLGSNWELILQEHNMYQFEIDFFDKTIQEDPKRGARTPSMCVRYWKQDQGSSTKHKSVVLTKYNGNMILLREIEKDISTLDIPDCEDIVGRVYGVWDYDISQKFKDVQGDPILREIAQPKTFWTADPQAGRMGTMAQATKYAQSIILYHDVEYDQVQKQDRKHATYIRKNNSDKNRFRISGDKNEYLFDYSGLDYDHIEGFRGLHDETRLTLQEQLESDSIDRLTYNTLFGLIDVNEHFLMSAQDRYVPHKVPEESMIDKLISSLKMCLSE
jgi:hypothetical protein